MIFRPAGWAASIGLAAATAIAAGQAPAGLRFHHLHLRVADPAAAMATFTRANGCVETILQGLGVGVRCGQVYLLFDRNDRPADGPVIRGAVTVSGSGEKAVVRARLGVVDPAAARTGLLDRLGIAVPATLSFVSATDASRMPDEITHLGLGAIDPAPVLTRLRAAGVAELSHTADATVLSGPGGLPIEIVRDEGLGPDVYWCPMHPDVRTAVPGTCPRCGMTLVPIPPPVFGDARMDVTVAPLGPTRARLTMRLLDPSGHPIPIAQLLTVHERVLHVFLVSRDLEFFQHVHPEAVANGTMTLDIAWPKPGVYGLFADFYPEGGTPQLLQTTVVTPGYRGSAFPVAPLLTPTGGTAVSAGGLRVRLDAYRLVAVREQTLTFTLEDARSGAPVTDLEPYLGAAGHLFVASADSVDAQHTHPTDLGAMGPVVKFIATFPRPGLYKMWVQFQRAGQVITLPFVVTVGS